jgi:hypothetical protein
MEGTVYNIVDDLSDEQWKRLYRTTEDLRYWMKGNLHIEELNSSVSAVPSDLVPMEAAEISNKTNSATPTSKASAKPAPPSLNPVNVLARAVTSDVNVDTPPPTIAAQVDEILQEKLEESPLKPRGIRLMELPDRGMVVLVGMDHYDGVDAVPDPEIKALIREAVAEWEARVEGNES